MTYASAYLIGAAVAVLLALLIVLNRVVLGPWRESRATPSPWARARISARD